MNFCTDKTKYIPIPHNKKCMALNDDVWLKGVNCGLCEIHQAKWLRQTTLLCMIDYTLL